jgi:hypothetical protein
MKLYQMLLLIIINAGAGRQKKKTQENVSSPKLTQGTFGSRTGVRFGGYTRPSLIKYPKHTLVFPTPPLFPALTFTST